MLTDVLATTLLARHIHSPVDRARFHTVHAVFAGLQPHLRGRVLDYGAGDALSMVALLDLGIRELDGVDVGASEVARGRFVAGQAWESSGWRGRGYLERVRALPSGYRVIHERPRARHRILRSVGLPAGLLDPNPLLVLKKLARAEITTAGRLRPVPRVAAERPARPDRAPTGQVIPAQGRWKPV